MTGVIFCMDDIERLKDLRDQLKDMGNGGGKAWLNQDYCREMGEILGRQIERMESEEKQNQDASKWAWSYPSPVPYWDRQDDFF